MGTVNFEAIRFFVELVIVLLITPFGMVLWSMLKGNQRKGESNEKALLEYKLHAAETFASKPDLATAIENIVRGQDLMQRTLERIDGKLDRKVDKS